MRRNQQYYKNVLFSCLSITITVKLAHRLSMVVPPKKKEDFLQTSMKSARIVPYGHPGHPMLVPGAQSSGGENLAEIRKNVSINGLR